MAPSNERGPIAQSYEQLQSIPELHQARLAIILPPGSLDSVNRTVLQAAEIALLNIDDLLNRASDDLSSGNTLRAAAKLGWAGGFHRLLVELSLVPQRMAPLERRQPSGILTLAESPAYQALRLTVRRFDRTAIETIGPVLEQALEDPSSHAGEASVAHLARICSHEGEIWERHLLRVPVWHEVPSYASYIAAPLLRAAACGLRLKGDTCFMQFRALHQIPETLALECCEQLRMAISEIRAARPALALIHLGAVNTLLHVVTFSVRPLVENLTTADYHQIRENLGVTSGSHSVVMRYKLFQDLYTAAGAAALENHYFESDVPESRLMAAEIFRLRAGIQLWRDLHIHLPRNHLGGSASLPTRSLIGSVNAVAAVEGMQREASNHDPLRETAAVWQLEPPERAGALAEHGESEWSLDLFLRECTGRITQRRFPDVQQRSGYFTRRPTHIPPPAEEI